MPTGSSGSASGARRLQGEDREALLARITAYLPEGTGTDTEGKDYESLREMWEEQGLLLPSSSRSSGSTKPPPPQQQQPERPNGPPEGGGEGNAAWYTQAAAYWEAESNCPPTVDGVLGGFGHVSPTDIAGSRAFVAQLRRLVPGLKLGRVVDCGAGIGRVTKHLLLPLFEKVDLLEQSPRLLAAAPAYLRAAEEASGDGQGEGEGDGEAAAAAAANPPLELKDERVSYICAGMQAFAPEAAAYDVVWIQWCIGHLHDVDLLSFLDRCKRALRPHGCVVVKDNCCADGGDFVVDKGDSSVTRSVAYLKALFRIAGFELRLEERQEGFPTELFPVFMLAFTPRPW